MDPGITTTTTGRVRVERIGQAGGGIESGDVVARLSADAGESAARQNLAVRLHRVCIDTTVRVRISRISRAGDRIEPRDVIARLSADAGEAAAHQNLAVRL